MTFPRKLWLETIKAPKKCGFCGAVMILAWDGSTPHGNFLAAYICPECFSTRFLCSNKNDPMFQTLTKLKRPSCPCGEERPSCPCGEESQNQIEGGEKHNE